MLSLLKIVHIPMHGQTVRNTAASGMRATSDMVVFTVLLQLQSQYARSQKLGT